MKINSVPCTLNFSESQNNSNLMKVKLVVMHEGENRNGSAFSMQSIESARESLKNVPILGYILRSDEGEALDFDEHNMSIKLVEGKDGYELKELPGWRCNTGALSLLNRGPRSLARYLR